jgi:hypothetical protein
MLRERYQIDLKRVNPQAIPDMANNVFGHKEGYNEVAEMEIKRRFGKASVETIWKFFYEMRRIRD